MRANLVRGYHDVLKDERGDEQQLIVRIRVELAAGRLYPKGFADEGRESAARASSNVEL